MKKLFLCSVLLTTVLRGALSCFAASSVYIPGVPTASSSAIGISCVYNYPATGTVYCNNQSPGPLVSGVGVVSPGYQNRLMFVTPGSYSWSIPASVTQAKLVVIGPGGKGDTGLTNGGGGGGGGYSESTISTSGATSVSVTVAAGASGASTSLTVGGTTIKGGAGGNGGSGAGGAGGCGTGGSINTCGGAGGNVHGGGGGAGGPYAAGGKSLSGAGGGGGGTGGGFGNGISTGCSTTHGQYGGYAFGVCSRTTKNPNGINNSCWWDTGDIQGDGGMSATVQEPQSTSGNFFAYAGDGGLGGGGGYAIYDAWCQGGFARVWGYAGNGSFGGGGGYGGYQGGNGGAGGGGGAAGDQTSGCYGSAGNGGNGIVIIYW